jgi:hypothetical protein
MCLFILGICYKVGNRFWRAWVVILFFWGGVGSVLGFVIFVWGRLCVFVGGEVVLVVLLIINFVGFIV